MSHQLGWVSRASTASFGGDGCDGGVVGGELDRASDSYTDTSDDTSEDWELIQHHDVIPRRAENM